jgi:Flp pilus assembly protein TadD
MTPGWLKTLPSSQSCPPHRVLHTLLERVQSGASLYCKSLNDIFFILFILSSFLSSSILVAIPQQRSPSPATIETLLKQGKVNEALQLLLQLHQSDPHNSQICLKIGVLYTQLEQLDKASAFYEKALKIDPALISARRNLATVLWFRNQKQESVRQFFALLRSNPNDSAAHFYLGTFEYERKQFLPARDHFGKAGNLAFGNPEALPMVLETYLAVKDMTVPNRLMSQLEQSERPDAELVFRVGTLFNTYGAYDQAVKAFKKLTSMSAVKPEVYLSLGEAYDKLGKADEAYQALSKVIALEPQSEDGYLALSSFSSAHQNNEFALRTVASGLEKIPGSSKLLLQQGILWALEGDLVRAETSFHQASQANEKWGLPRLAMGLSQLQAGKLSQAAQTFQELAKDDPTDYRPQYLYALSLVRAGAQGDVSRRDKVIMALRRAIQLNPEDAESRVLLGQTYLSADQLESAVTELQKAIELDSRNSTAHYQLGVAYRKQGKFELAQQQLRTFEELKARQKDEENEERKALILMLKTVREK